MSAACTRGVVIDDTTVTYVYRSCDVNNATAISTSCSRSNTNPIEHSDSVRVTGCDDMELLSLKIRSVTNTATEVCWMCDVITFS